MDASSVAATALAVAVDESRDAALRELLLDRECAAMQAEDLRSYVAQRHFTTSLLVPRAPAMTWEAAYAQRHADLQLAHDAMRAALRAVRQGDDEGAEERLAVQVGDSDEEEEESETSDDESDGGALVCVLCGRSSSRSRRRQMFTMVAGGRWAGLAPGARVVCSDCRTEALGPIE